MKLCFDECMPPKWFGRLSEMLELRKLPIKSTHLLQELRSGTQDDAIVQWLISQSPHMMIISGDNAQRSGRYDPRLPTLCPQWGVTSVFIGRKLCQREGFEKVRMIMVCLPELVAAYEGARGLRYRLE